MNHHRRNSRLADHNYSENGYYYVTVCSRDHGSIFGEIRSSRMVSNHIGEIVGVCWSEIPKHFPRSQLDAFVVMPDHIHGIVIIDDESADQISESKVVGDADLRPLRSDSLGKFKNPHNCDRSKMLLSKIIHGFKSSVTRTVHNKYPGTRFAWQKSFYDHIIRNEDDLMRIRSYIVSNPLRWSIDRLNGEKVSKESG